MTGCRTHMCGFVCALQGITECKRADVARTDQLGQVEEQTRRTKHLCLNLKNSALLIVFLESSNTPSWCRSPYVQRAYVNDDFTLSTAVQAENRSVLNRRQRRLAHVGLHEPTVSRHGMIQTMYCFRACA